LKVLGLSENPTKLEVKQRFRKLAKTEHPDKFTDSILKKQAEEKFKKIINAYDNLMKKLFDRSIYMF